ncbi:unnamed protein product [Vicia faba]|uniref:Uncharacterized protein n=1 Tax=Vicia faba TaxID=3906 RepID=A0AAV0YUN9_VICFA|nr:unnamed protein product [Vicia faba]
MRQTIRPVISSSTKNKPQTHTTKSAIEFVYMSTYICIYKGLIYKNSSTMNDIKNRVAKKVSYKYLTNSKTKPAIDENCPNGRTTACLTLSTQNRTESKNGSILLKNQKTTENQSPFNDSNNNKKTLTVTTTYSVYS